MQYLWIQDRIRSGELKAEKVPGTQNPADMLTKHLPAGDIQRYSEELGIAIHDDRTEVAPNLAHVSTAAADDNDYDHWVHHDDCLDRVHVRPRLTTFTPLRVNGAPTAQTFTATRITEGRYVQSGQHFRVADNWTGRGTAHSQLQGLWTGRTRFVLRTGDSQRAQGQ